MYEICTINHKFLWFSASGDFMLNSLGSMEAICDTLNTSTWTLATEEASSLPGILGGTLPLVEPM